FLIGRKALLRHGPTAIEDLLFAFFKDAGTTITVGVRGASSLHASFARSFWIAREIDRAFVVAQAVIRNTTESRLIRLAMRALGTHVAVRCAMATHAAKNVGSRARRITQLRFIARNFSLCAAHGRATVGRW